MFQCYGKSEVTHKSLKVSMKISHQLQMGLTGFSSRCLKPDLHFSGQLAKICVVNYPIVNVIKEHFIHTTLKQHLHFTNLTCLL